MSNMADNSDIGIAEIQQFYNSEALHKFQSLTSRQTLLEICKKRTSETVHSAFLKWLFENAEFARLPLSPIVTLLRLYASKAYEQGTNVDKGLIKEILSGNVKSVWNVEGYTEQHTSDNRRVDIELIFDYGNCKKGRICIENKLYTKEHNNQCAAYYRHYSELNDGRINLFIFLSPDSSNTTAEPHYVNLTYQDIYDSVLYPLYNNYKEHHSNRSINYLKEYIDTLTAISEEYQPIVMSNEYKELLTEIYKNHRDLFFEAISYAGTDEDKALANQATGTNLVYTVQYGDSEPKVAKGYTKLARIVIESLVENGVSDNEIKNKIGKVDFPGFDKTVLDFESTKGADSRYNKTPIETAEHKIYVSNQWNKDKANIFIELATTTFTELKISTK